MTYFYMMIHERCGGGDTRAGKKHDTMEFARREAVEAVSEHGGRAWVVRGVALVEPFVVAVEGESGDRPSFYHCGAGRRGELFVMKGRGDENDTAGRRVPKVVELQHDDGPCGGARPVV